MGFHEVGYACEQASVSWMQNSLTLTREKCQGAEGCEQGGVVQCVPCVQSHVESMRHRADVFAASNWI